MCCGAKRTLARNLTRTGAQVQRQTIAAPGAAAQAAPSTVLFEYTGKTRLTVISPTTGARYHFDAPGAQAPVDRRDQAMMIYVPGLQPVRFQRS